MATSGPTARAWFRSGGLKTGHGEEILRIAYPEPYLVFAGAPALGAPVFDIAAFALFVITVTVLTSAGQPRVAALIAGLALGVVLLATQFFISVAGPNQGALIAAGSAPALVPSSPSSARAPRCTCASGRSCHRCPSSAAGTPEPARSRPRCTSHTAAPS